MADVAGTHRVGIDVGEPSTAWAAVEGATTAARVPLGDLVPSVVAVLHTGAVIAGGEVTAAEQRLLRTVVQSFVPNLGSSAPLMIEGVPYGAEALVGQLIASVVRAAQRHFGVASASVSLAHPDGMDPYRTGLLAEAARVAGVPMSTVVLVPYADARAALQRASVRTPVSPAFEHAVGAALVAMERDEQQAAAAAGPSTSGSLASLVAGGGGAALGAGGVAAFAGDAVAGAAGGAGAAPGVGFSGSALSGPAVGPAGAPMAAPGGAYAGTPLSGGGYAGTPIAGPGAGPGGGALTGPGGSSLAGPGGTPAAGPGVGPAGAPLSGPGAGPTGTPLGGPAPTERIASVTHGAPEADVAGAPPPTETFALRSGRLPRSAARSRRLAIIGAASVVALAVTGGAVALVTRDDRSGVSAGDAIVVTTAPPATNPPSTAPPTSPATSPPPVTVAAVETAPPPPPTTPPETTAAPPPATTTRPRTTTTVRTTTTTTTQPATTTTALTFVPPTCREINLAVQRVIGKIVPGDGEEFDVATGHLFTRCFGTDALADTPGIVVRHSSYEIWAFAPDRLPAQLVKGSGDIPGTSTFDSDPRFGRGATSSAGRLVNTGNGSTAAHEVLARCGNLTCWVHLEQSVSPPDKDLSTVDATIAKILGVLDGLGPSTIPTTTAATTTTTFVIG